MTRKKKSPRISTADYEVKPYTRGGWVITAKETGREIVRFNDRNSADSACTILNESEE